MAYTNVWSSVLPSGSAAASSIDDELRKIRVDMEERLLGLFVSPFTTDPLVVKPAVLGNVTGKKAYLGYAAFKTGNGQNESLASDASYIQDDAPPIKRVCPLSAYLIEGIQITRIKLYHDPKGDTVNFRVVSVSKTGVLATVLANVPDTSNTGFVEKDSGALTITLATDLFYNLIWETTSASTPRLIGAEITYDVTDCRQTR